METSYFTHVLRFCIVTSVYKVVVGLHPPGLEGGAGDHLEAVDGLQVDGGRLEDHLPLVVQHWMHPQIVRLLGFYFQLLPKEISVADP